MTTELATKSMSEMTTYTGDLDILDELTKGSTFLRRLTLYQGTHDEVKEGKIPLGHWGIKTVSGEITDLGKEIDCMVFAVRPKALDSSDRNAIVESFDPKSETFSAIRAAAAVSTIKHKFGVTFLMFVKEFGECLEFFCYSKSLRIAAQSVLTYLPRTAKDIEKQATHLGVDADTLEPERKAKPFTMRSFLTPDKGNGNRYFVPQVVACTQPINNLPAANVIAGELDRFLSKPSTELVTAEDDASSPDR